MAAIEPRHSVAERHGSVNSGQGESAGGSLTCQRRTVASALPEASVLPSSVNATLAVTLPV